MPWIARQLRLSSGPVRVMFVLVAFILGSAEILCRCPRAAVIKKKFADRGGAKTHFSLLVHPASPSVGAIP